MVLSCSCIIIWTVGIVLAETAAQEAIMGDVCAENEVQFCDE